jgi:hypothetical protein
LIIKDLIIKSEIFINFFQLFKNINIKNLCLLKYIKI